MKLTLNRRESTIVETGCNYYVKSDLRAWPAGKVLYYLDIALEATPDEMALIDKHAWGALPLCRGGLQDVSGTVNFDLSDFVQPEGDLVLPVVPWKLGFEHLDNLANVESQLRENVRKLNQQFGAAAQPPQAAEKSGRCFIATAAYGTPAAPDVQLLRQFRDTVLVESKTGRFVSAWYSKLSPRLARWIHANDASGAFVRACLRPVVAAIKFSERNHPQR